MPNIGKIIEESKNFTKAPTTAEEAYYAAEKAMQRWRGPYADEAERLISCHAVEAYSYARIIMQHRWDGPHAGEAEKNIAQNRTRAADYSVFVLHSRFPEPFRKKVERDLIEAGTDSYELIMYIHYLKQSDNMADFLGFIDDCCTDIPEYRFWAMNEFHKFEKEKFGETSAS